MSFFHLVQITVVWEFWHTNPCGFLGQNPMSLHQSIKGYTGDKCISFIPTSTSLLPHHLCWLQLSGLDKWGSIKTNQMFLFLNCVLPLQEPTGSKLEHSVQTSISKPAHSDSIIFLLCKIYCEFLIVSKG